MSNSFDNDFDQRNQTRGKLLRTTACSALSTNTEPRCRVEKKQVVFGGYTSVNLGMMSIIRNGHILFGILVLVLYSGSFISNTS